MSRRLSSHLTATVAAFVSVAFLAGQAFAEDGVTVSKDSSDGLLVTIATEAANIHYTYAGTGCGSGIPCLVVQASQGMVGIPVSAGGACKATAGNGSTPSVIECPSAGVRSVTFQFKKGGTWSAYEGGGGLHANGCSPAPATVKTGPEGVVSVNSWNGCPETVICDSPAGVITMVEADAVDVVRGTCTSIIRH